MKSLLVRVRVVKHGDARYRSRLQVDGRAKKLSGAVAVALSPMTRRQRTAHVARLMFNAIYGKFGVRK